MALDSWCASRIFACYILRENTISKKYFLEPIQFFMKAHNFTNKQ